MCVVHYKVSEGEALLAGFAESNPPGPLRYFAPIFVVQSWDAMTTADHMEAAVLLVEGRSCDNPCRRRRGRDGFCVSLFLGSCVDLAFELLAFRILVRNFRGVPPELAHRLIGDLARAGPPRDRQRPLLKVFAQVDPEFRADLVLTEEVR